MSTRKSIFLKITIVINFYILDYRMYIDFAMQYIYIIYLILQNIMTSYFINFF